MFTEEKPIVEGIECSSLAEAQRLALEQRKNAQDAPG
jgi:hypothetical protein